MPTHAIFIYSAKNASDGLFTARIVSRFIPLGDNTHSLNSLITNNISGCSQWRLRLPEFLDNWHMKVIRLSALCSGHFYIPGDTPGTHFCFRLNQPQGHSVAGRMKSMKNSNDSTGNQTCNPPACSTVPQLTVPLQNPVLQ